MGSVGEVEGSECEIVCEALGERYFAFKVGDTFGILSGSDMAQDEDGLCALRVVKAGC